MAAPVSIKVDTSEFSRAMREYLPHSKRAFSEIINQKGYSIAIAAVAITKRASKAQIRSDLSDHARVGMMVNANRARRGEKGLSGEAMREAVKKFIQQHVDAVNFLRAGWLPAVVAFARAIGKAPRQNAMRFLARFGYHGEGQAASKATWFPKASLSNMAFSRWTSTTNGVKFAEAGLSRAIAQEVARMAEHIAKKQQREAARFVGRSLR